MKDPIVYPGDTIVVDGSGLKKTQRGILRPCRSRRASWRFDAAHRKSTSMLNPDGRPRQSSCPCRSTPQPWPRPGRKRLWLWCDRHRARTIAHAAIAQLQPQSMIVRVSRLPRATSGSPPGSSTASPTPPRGRGCRMYPASNEDQERARQACAARTALYACAALAVRAAQDGVRDPSRPVAAWTALALGGGTAGAIAAGIRWLFRSGS